MKILWFTNTPCGAMKKLASKGSSGGWLYALEYHLKKREEIELHIAFYYPKKIVEFEFEGVFYHPIYDNRFSNKIRTLIGNYKEYFIGFSNHNIASLKAIIDKVNPNLIHYHGTEQDFGLLQEFVKDIPSVLSIQGILNSCREKLYSGVPANIISRHESFLSKLSLTTIKMNNKRFLFTANRERTILRITKNIIGRTDFDYHATLTMAPNATYFIGNEILRKEFYHAEWKKNQFNKEFTIISTISAGFYKGLEVILRTARHLKEREFPFRWYVIGMDETSPNATIISKWLKTKYKSNNVMMLGLKSATEIIQILQKGDIYCQTSHIENSPNSVCEAMMLGIPIVASYAGGTSSILEHKKEGYLIQEGDSYSLAGTLIDIYHNFEQANTWGKNARKRALIRHNPERVVNEYIDIYKTILK